MESELCGDFFLFLFVCFCLFVFLFVSYNLSKRVTDCLLASRTSTSTRTDFQIQTFFQICLNLKIGSSTSRCPTCKQAVSNTFAKVVTDE